MNRCFLMVAGIALAFNGSLFAQKLTPRTGVETPADNPLSTEMKQAYRSVKNNIIKSAEQMSDENYSFKPTSDIRSFGQVIAHIADSQMRTCSAVLGEQKSVNAASKTSKSDLFAALQDAFAECDKAYDPLVDADAAHMIKTPRGERSKLGVLVGNLSHDNEQYGIMTVYLRLKGLIPPSSQR